MKIAARYNWLSSIEDAPKIMKELVRLGKLDTSEIPGSKSNEEIMLFAKDAGVSKIYTSDEIAWCAVLMCALIVRSGRKLPFKLYDRLRASSFLKYGIHVNVPMFDDYLIFSRPGGYHVGKYVAEDAECYHVGGGNQGNQISVVRISKTRLVAARREVYINQPKSVKRIFVDAIGGLSENEA